MFEKEAEEYSLQKALMCESSSTDLKEAYLDGVEFGYNNANEWHKVSEKLPPSGETVLLYFGTDIMGQAVMCTGCVDCRGEWYKNVDEEPYMWQEIVLPKESE